MVYELEDVLQESSLETVLENRKQAVILVTGRECQETLAKLGIFLENIENLQPRQRSLEPRCLQFDRIMTHRFEKFANIKIGSLLLSALSYSVCEICSINCSWDSTS